MRSALGNRSTSGNSTTPSLILTFTGSAINIASSSASCSGVVSGTAAVPVTRVSRPSYVARLSRISSGVKPTRAAISSETVVAFTQRMRISWTTDSPS